MPRALILVADGSEEIEFVTPYDAVALSLAPLTAVREHGRVIFNYLQKEANM
ncbi:unnamed protein product [Alternaria alternata]